MPENDITRRNIAVIGAGYWGKNLVRNFAALGALHAVCDASPATLQSYEHLAPAVRLTTDVDSVLADPAVEGVVIATPAATHYHLAMQALEAGKDVFVEKPLALSVSEGRQLVDEAESRGRVLLVGHLLEYHPALARLRAMLAAGDLGKLLYIYSNRLNLGKFRTEENILWSFAPHDIAAILGMVGDMLPSRLSAHGSSYLNSGIVDVTLTNMEFSNDVRAHIFVSWLHPYKEQRLVVVGSDGMAVFADTDPEHKLRVYHHHVRWLNGVPTPVRAEGRPVDFAEVEPLRNECEDFLHCMRDRATPVSSGPRALKVLQVLQACQESLDAHGTWVSPASAAPAGFYVHETAVVEEPDAIGEGTKIWHFTHVMPGAAIGRHCILGQNVFVGNDVRIGNGVKVQNNVSLYEGVVLEDDVFCGPSCVFTNVVNPRAAIARRDEFRQTVVRRGATIGANAVIVCGHTIGEYAFVGAGAVVTCDVPAYALVYGNPARQHGWMCRCGVRLQEQGDGWTCRHCGASYRRSEEGLAPVPEVNE